MKTTALKALAVVTLIASVVFLGGYGVMAQSSNDTGTDGGYNTTSGTSNTSNTSGTNSGTNRTNTTNTANTGSSGLNSNTNATNTTNTTNTTNRSMTSTSSSNGIGTGSGTVSTSSSSTTPGVPNTGAGGDATMNLLLLLGSAVLAAGGLTYMIKGFQAR